MFINTLGEESQQSIGNLINVGFGRTSPEKTDWIDYATGGGIYVTVDTSSAGFINTPLYFTSIGGVSYHWTVTGGSAIYQPTNKSFRIYVRRPDAVSEITVEAMRIGKWYINWVGIETR